MGIGAMIITSMPNEISEALINTFDSGLTKMDAIGGYSNSKKSIIYFVVNRFQVTKMKEVVHEIDPTAFITITEIADVFSANMKQ